MPSVVSQHCEERELGPAVALAESVNHVQLRQEMRRLKREIIGHKVFKKAARLQRREQLRGLGLDLLRKAERIALFRNAHRAGFPRPCVDILEQVMMDGTIMREIKLAFGQRLAGSRVADFGLEGVEFVLVAQVELVHEDC